jgi:hypothetical protein
VTPLTHGLTTTARRVAIRFGLIRQSVDQHLRQRIADADDRGEGPVSTAIMVALIAAVAVAVGGVILLVANGWTARIPRATP